MARRYLFVVIHGFVAVVLEFIAFDGLKVLVNQFGQRLTCLLDNDARSERCSRVAIVAKNRRSSRVTANYPRQKCANCALARHRCSPLVTIRWQKFEY